MDIIYNEWTGHPSELNLTKSIGSYLRNDAHYHIKIGITNNPEARSRAHGSDLTWGKMAVIYKTSSLKYVRDVERMLIEHIKENCTADCNLINEIGGGGGSYGEPPYYVYLLLSKKWNLRST